MNSAVQPAHPLDHSAVSPPADVSGLVPPRVARVADRISPRLPQRYSPIQPDDKVAKRALRPRFCLNSVYSRWSLHRLGLVLFCSLLAQREGCSEASRQVSGLENRAVSRILQRHRGCGRQASRGASGVSWPMDQSGWMAWDEDHPAEDFRHSSVEIGADGVWASFSTLATEEAGIPSRRGRNCVFSYSGPLPGQK